MPCREQLNKVQAELTYTSNKCSALSQENELLRGQPRMPHCPAEEADPLSEQVGMILLRQAEAGLLRNFDSHQGRLAEYCDVCRLLPSCKLSLKKRQSWPQTMLGLPSRTAASR